MAKTTFILIEQDSEPDIDAARVSFTLVNLAAVAYVELLKSRGGARLDLLTSDHKGLYSFFGEDIRSALDALAPFVAETPAATAHKIGDGPQ